MDSDSDSDDDKPSDYTWVLPILLLGVAAQRQEQPQGLARLYILAMPGICKLRPCLAKIISPDCTNNQDSDYFCQTRTLIIIIAIII